MKRTTRCLPVMLGLVILIGLLSLTGFLVPSQVWAQGGTGNVEIRFEETDPSRFPTITTRVTVLDPEGVPTTGLDTSNFAVFEDGQRVPVSRLDPFVNPNVQTAVALVIDISGSMYGGKINEAKAAARSFVEGLETNDMVAVIAFRGKDGDVNLDESDPSYINPEWEIDFTNDKARVLALIDGLDVPGPRAGRTNLYDALFKAIRMTSKVSGVDYQTLMAFTDGNEKCKDCGGSVLKEDDPIDEAKKEGIPVFTIGVGEDADNAYLQRVALVTGGRHFDASTENLKEELAGIYQDVYDQIRQQYAVTYQAKAEADGEEHKLDLKVTTPDGEGQKVVPVAYPCPEKPGVRLSYLKPNPVRGRDPTVESLKDGLTVEPDFTIVPDIQACHPIEKVELWIDGDLVFTAENPPFNLIHDFYDMQVDAPGAHQLAVRAYDDIGNVSDDKVVKVNVPSIVPTAGPGTPAVTGAPGVGDLIRQPPADCSNGLLLVGVCVPRWLLAVLGLLLILLLLAVVLLLTRPKREEPYDVQPEYGFGGQPAPEPPVADLGYFPEDITAPEIPQLSDAPAGEANMGVPTAMPAVHPPVMAGPPPAEATVALHRQPERLGWLIVEQGERIGKEYRLQPDDTSIGRSGENDIVLSDPAVSRQHTKIRLEGDGYYVYDLAATNPTLVNGQEIGRYQLMEGDRLQVGNTILVFKEMQTG